MREIIFRGKDKFTGEWRYGDLVHNKRVTTTGLEPRVMVGGYEVLDNTVGQYTGFKDKKEKEIYEGDIVIFYYRDGYGIIRKRESVVFYKQQDFMVYLLIDYSPLISNITDIEVIGNIFDNPELIK